MAAPSTNSTINAVAADNGAPVVTNAPLATIGTAAAAVAAAAATAASNVWPNTRDSYELREVIGKLTYNAYMSKLSVYNIFILNKRSARTRRFSRLLSFNYYSVDFSVVRR